MTEWDRAITTVVAYLRDRSANAAMRGAVADGEPTLDAFAAVELVSRRVAEAIEREFLGKPIPGGDDERSTEGP